ncbi:MAG: Crp/Fnr family transcriptional regulator [Fulvivirga sp.]|uniref:Crp/Fnr family transcriptional regulator n=1 Tax=Fulvivirga sp. TaxID=1931237 RepID=UPI0032F08C5A
MDRTQIQSHLENTGLEPPLVAELLNLGKFKEAKVGEVVVKSGSRSQYIPLVLSGVLKVMREDPEKGDVFLYYLEGGETCAMSISCCLEPTSNQFKVTAEEDSEVWMIPMDHLDSWIVKYPAFRKFIFSSYKMRFDELLNTIDSMAFMNLDERLYKYLLDKKQSSGSFEINKTHAEIARELNTSRVVISRLLKKLEKEDKIEQHRNKIEIL